MALTEFDRELIAATQSGLPLVARPYEAVGAMLTACGSPLRAVVGIGATRYTPVGESTYLVAGDESIVASIRRAARLASAPMIV